MSDIKRNSIPFEIDGKTYSLSFTLSVDDDIQDEFGSISKMLDEIDTVDCIVKVLRIIINNDIERQNEEKGTSNKKITDRWLKNRIEKRHIGIISNAIVEAYKESFDIKKHEEIEEDEIENPN